MATPLTKEIEGRFVVRYKEDGKRSGETYHLRRNCGMIGLADNLEVLDLDEMSDTISGDDMILLMKLFPCKTCRQWQERPGAEDAVAYALKMAALGCQGDPEAKPFLPADEEDVNEVLLCLRSVGWKITTMSAKERREAGLDW